MIYSENILLCMMVPFLIMMFFTTHDVRRFCIAFLLGMTVSLLSAYINSFYLYMIGYSLEEGVRLVTPIIEEIMKCVPVVLYLVFFVPDNKQLLDFAATVAIGYATFENFCYISASGAEQVYYVLIRGFAVGVMHLVTGLIIGMGLASVRRYQSIMVSGCAGVLSFTIVFHALYNLLVSVEGLPRQIGFAFPIVIAAAIWILKEQVAKHEHENEHEQEHPREHADGTA